MRKVVAVLLAGGVGSRLNVLVQYRAKPAVPFGGIYRIIDFTLSNIANCGLTRVAVLTQYKPLSLMDHIGDGSAWDLAGRTRGISILPPKTGEKDWDWYKGTADAVRQNLSFISSGPYTDVLIVSGDHVYCMDYWPLIHFHREHNAHVTIGMIPVPWEETRHFGTGTLDGQNRIIDWQEKSDKSRSNLASMGIYVFEREYLVRTLGETKEEDFGKQIIPRALKEGKRVRLSFRELLARCGHNTGILGRQHGSPQTGIGAQPGRLRHTDEPGGRGPPVRPPSRQGERFVMRGQFRHFAGLLHLGRRREFDPLPRRRDREGRLRQGLDHHARFGGQARGRDREVNHRQRGRGRGKCRYRPGKHGKANMRFPDHIYSGLTVIGKNASIPEGAIIGTNCIIYPAVNEEDFPSIDLKDGETVEKRE